MSSTEDFRRMSRLWDRMTAMYGSRWVVEYSDLSTDSTTLAPLAVIWAEALADIGNDAIAAGLRKCLDRDSPHPPSLPEFLRLCGRRKASAAGAHQPRLTADFHPDFYADTPSARCAQLAAELAESARIELAPRLAAVLPDDRRRVIAAYWLAKMAAIGPVGERVAEVLRPKTAPQEEEAA
jgi:hypothetical protein